MEEEKQTRVHFDIAKRIVDTIANGEDQISQQAVLQVLKPLLEENISLAIQKFHKIPERWFTN
jgi:UDP-N-acetyl-D-mannosaminuronate dehydrogenase